MVAVVARAKHSISAPCAYEHHESSTQNRAIHMGGGRPSARGLAAEVVVEESLSCDASSPLKLVKQGIYELLDLPVLLILQMGLVTVSDYIQF